MEESPMLQFMSAEINEISVALSAFQGSIKQPNLNKEVKVDSKKGYTYKFKYADLSTCISAASPSLKENGLSVVQIIYGQKLITILTHKSGQWFRSEVDIRIAPDANYQELGSAITYLKRYSYCAILGIVADIDDDAISACGNQAEITETSKAKKTSTLAYTGEQLAQALNELQQVTNSQEYEACWKKWISVSPALCTKGTEFYNACSEKAQKLAEFAKQKLTEQKQ